MPGLELTPTGVRAEVHAPRAELVELCLFDPEGNETRHPLSAHDGSHQTEVAGVSAGARYGFRTHGPWSPEEGLWHHPDLLLLDPYARAVSGDFTDHPTTRHDGPRQDSAPWVPRGIVVDPPPAPRPGPQVPWSETVIYETHVRSLTAAHPEVEPRLRGTYLGACSDPVIDHLLHLGVTTVELMPVAQHFSEPFLQQRGMRNYWGYSTLGWFAPHAAYATGDDGRQVQEFVEMVDRFHGAGLEVIVDVVFNHTVEGGREGPILSQKGLDNRGWYRLDDHGDYLDWTGTGNTVDTADPRVREAIVAALRWWSEGLGVDGFRFDLAVTLGRGADGQFDPTHLEWLTSTPGMSERKLIAEPWDVGPDGYRLGGFGGEWREWNARFRDDVRDYWRGQGSHPTFSLRMSGSPDVFPSGPSTAIELVTAHDGFTLADLVSYDHKHNEANGEDNRDGHNDNRSWNSGAEGASGDSTILETRRRRSAALLSSVLLSAGVPMLLGGDELGRSKGGNNNSYPVDEANWYRWDRKTHVDLVHSLVDIRRQNPDLGGGYQLMTDGPAGLQAAGAWLLATNPTGDDTEVSLPEGTWEIAFDSTGITGGEEHHRSQLRVPAWSLLLVRPVS